MLTVLLVALGGALGSVLRYGLGNLVVVLTGPAFPWGTILVNIVGSFVIGGFGALTATDGRFAVPGDARAFVMVGICGGFTTFSSFSLQTFDLFRDGRSAQAAANVAMSVVLCVLGTWAGVAAATALRQSPIAAVAPLGGKRLADRTLVALHDPDMAPTMLAAAASVMARSRDRTTVLAIDGPVLADLQPTEEIRTAERGREAAARRRDWVEALRPILDRWVAAERASGFRAGWQEVRGDGVAAIAEHGHRAHLLLLDYGPNDAGSRDRLRAGLLRTGRPVLVIPRGATMRDATGFEATAGAAGGGDMPFPLRDTPWPPDPDTEALLRGHDPVLLRLRPS